MIPRVVLAALLGVLTWTFLEYVIHRWMGHDKRFHKTPFGREHVRHHIEGDYFAPTWKKAIAAGILLAIVAPIGILVAGVGPGLGYALGLIGCYVGYEVQHRRNHTHAGIGGYGRWARRHHFHHHFADPRSNHGVSTPLWDLVFGTYQRPAVITVPPRLAMAWLVDAGTGAVHVAYAGNYRLGKPVAPR